VAASVLFLLGVCFSFFLLVPGTIRVSIELNELFGFITRWTPGSYYGTLIWLTLGVGAAFEFPLLIVILVYLGLVTSEQLRGWWRHALIVSFVVAAFVTPTPDPINQSILAISLYLLYWVAIVAAKRVEKRQREAAL
jgi:sec-independent protein translocase protein TatC